MSVSRHCLQGVCRLPLPHLLAVEGSYVDFGAPDDYLENLDGTVQTDVTGYDAFAVGLLPLGIADIFAKVGFISWDASISGQVGGEAQSESEDGDRPRLTASASSSRIKSFAIRGEVEYFDIEGAEYVYMYSIGGSYTF